MSYDVHLENGDFVLGGQGDLEYVADTHKLVQDVLKAVYTPVGSDPFNPDYGVSVTAQNIGTPSDLGLLQVRLQSDLIRVIDFLRSNQQAQIQIQELTSGEVVLGTANVVVQVNSDDPRQLDVEITVRSQGHSDIVLAFNMTTFLNDPFNPNALRSYS